MNSVAPFTSTQDLVAAAVADLTPTERRIAEAVVAEPTLLAFGSVSDLAGHVGTSRPPIVRFATKLGFDGYTQLQQHVRSALSRQLSRPSERIRSEGDAAVPVRASIEESIGSVFDALEKALSSRPVPFTPAAALDTLKHLGQAVAETAAARPAF